MSTKWLKQTSTSFQEKDREVILKVGRDEFTCQDLMEWKCRNFTAARRLSKVLATLKPRSVRNLAIERHFTVEDFFALDGLGEASMWVWMNTLHACGIDVDKWLDTSLKVSTLHEQGRLNRKRQEKIVPFRKKIA